MAQVELTEGRKEGGRVAIKLTMAGHFLLSMVSMGAFKRRQLQSKKEKQVPERGNSRWWHYGAKEASGAELSEQRE